MKTAQYDTPAQLAYYEAVRVVDANYAAAAAVAKTDGEFRAAAWARLTAFKAARAAYEATLAEGTESE